MSILTNMQIAEVAHGVNRAYCEATGDRSQPLWEDADDWQKNSALQGVLAINGNLTMTPEDSHVGWLATKNAAGWKHGPIKDTAKKEHPCMVPYDELPPFQRVKDHLFTATVRTLLGITS